MGAAASIVGSGAGDDSKTFMDTFSALGEKTVQAKSARRQAWMAADPNGNGYLSLAELDGWIQKSLMLDNGNDEGDRLWKAFRPCYIRAFNDAKDIGTEKRVAGTISATTEDYVTRGEFRLCNAYLCIYAAMFDAFSKIDGKGDGTTADDDRRISLEEWQAGYESVKDHGFAALAKVADESTEDSPDSVFAEMDADSKGMVLLNEWCKYIEKGEQEAGTSIGAMLAIGDDSLEP